MEKSTTVDSKLLEQFALQRLRAIRTATQDIQTLKEQIKALERKKERSRQHKRDFRRE
ncbi:hypothetical protein J4E85_008445 [Alternaria conjuncta]|uniref:uncharacterized protein n=1 Tax=Alternaria conjuncta TaxID=181017 RepID=UPI00221FD048|nr:uncharacterized protein J4E85_008445 [Alternaria conjuncta]KAI4923407.1 hypothetical protein J4E85_008445 [Alternaria conjuncta]